MTAPCRDLPRTAPAPEQRTSEPEAPYCRTCDLDLHYCPGCGANASHDKPVCDACNAPDVPAEALASRYPTITSAHRAALRRIGRGERVHDIAHIVRELGVSGLAWRVAADGLSGWALTDEGRALLAAHDALSETRRTERPVLTSKPFPPRWRTVSTSNGGNVRHYTHTVHALWVETYGASVAPWSCMPAESSDFDARAALEVAEDVVALLRWDAHQRAVAAQAVTP